MRDYTKYKVWVDSVEFSVSIYKMTKGFPVDEKFGLISQMRRSSVSIASNIAEGASRSSEKEFSRFVEIAMGSSFEVKTQLIISQKLEYIKGEVFSNLLLKVDEISKQLNALRTTLKKL